MSRRRIVYGWPRQGIRLPLPDAVIAACVRRIGAVVLTHDRHFEQIPGVRSTDRIPVGQ